MGLKLIDVPYISFLMFVSGVFLYFLVLLGEFPSIFSKIGLVLIFFSMLGVALTQFISDFSP